MQSTVQRGQYSQSLIVKPEISAIAVRFGGEYDSFIV